MIKRVLFPEIIIKDQFQCKNNDILQQADFYSSIIHQSCKMEQFPIFDKHLTKEITVTTFKCIADVQINDLFPQTLNAF